MHPFKSFLVYGGFVAFVAALILQYFQMREASIVACFLFAPGYFISMIELQRARARRQFELGRASVLKETAHEV